MTEKFTGNITPPSGPQRFSRAHATTEGVYENAETFVTGNVGEWGYSYTQPKAQGFFASFADRRAWKNVNFQAGLTGRHTEAQNWNRVLSGMPEAQGDRGFTARVATGAGAVLPFFENVTSGFDVDGALAPDGTDWDAAAEVAKVDPFVMKTGAKYDPDFAAKLASAQSKRGFDLTINRAMKSTQLLQQIEADDQSGALGGWGSSVLSAVGNYVIFDEDTTRTLGFGAIVKGVAGAGRGIEKLSSLAMKAAIGGSYRSKSIASKPFISDNPMLALHTFIATKAGVTKAAAIEGAALGVGWDIGFQTDAMRQADLMYGDDQNMVVYHPSHTLLAGGMGAGIGAAIPTLINKLSKSKTGGAERYPDDIAALVEDGQLSMEGLARQHTDDAAMDSINNRVAALSVVGSDEMPGVGWALSREMLENNGRTIDELDAFVRHIETASDHGVDTSSGVLLTWMEQFMVEGIGVVKTSTKAKRKRAAKAKQAAAQAVADAGGSAERALETVRAKRAGKRAEVTVADELGVSRGQVSTVKGMPMLNVAHTGTAPSGGAIWPGSHFGSREASAHFGGAGKTSNMGALQFKKAVMMSDTQGQHDPRALIQELINHSRSTEGNAFSPQTVDKLNALFNDLEAKGFQRGAEAVPAYKRIGVILQDELGADAIVYRNAQEDAGSVSFISFREGQEGFQSMPSQVFQSFAADSAEFEKGALRISVAQFDDFLSGLGEREQTVWKSVQQRIKDSDPSLTDDEAASLAGNLFGLRRGMFPEIGADIRNSAIHWDPEKGVQSAMVDLIDRFRGSNNPIDDHIANQLENNAALLSADAFSPVSDAALRDADAAYFLQALSVGEDAAKRLDDDGWFTGIKIMDDIASDMLPVHPADYTPDGATALTLRAVEAMVDDGAVPPALRKAFLSVRERVVMTFKDQKLDTEVLIRAALDWMPEKDKKALLQGVATELERTLEHRSKSVHDQVSDLLANNPSAIDRMLKRQPSFVKASPPVRLPANRPVTVLSPAERKAAKGQIALLTERANDPAVSAQERRAAANAAADLGESAGLTSNGYYSASPVFDHEIALAVKVSGRNIAELADSASQMTLFKFQQLWIGKNLAENDPLAMRALGRIWWEANNKRNKLSGLVVGSPHAEKLPPIKLREGFETLDQDIFELEALEQLVFRHFKEQQDELNEAIRSDKYMGDPTNPEYVAKVKKVRELDEELYEISTAKDKALAEKAERSSELEVWLDNNPEAVSVTMLQKPAKTYATERAAAVIQKFVDDPAAFRNISDNHKRLGLALEAAVNKGHLSENVARMTRAIWAQSDLKFLEHVDIRFTGKHEPLLANSNRMGAQGVVERSHIGKDGKQKFRTTPSTKQPRDNPLDAADLDDAQQVIGHELLHVALMTTPGLRKEWVKIHAKLINSPRALGRARAALEEIMPGQDSQYYNYFLTDADEFFVEFGSRYLTDTKFRDQLLNAADATWVQKFADSVMQGLGRVVPYVRDLNIGMNKAQMERFFGMVDQAAGFKPLQRQAYIDGKKGELKWLSDLMSPASNRTTENLETAFPMAELIEKIRAANAKGDDELVAKLNKQMAKAYGKRVTTSGTLQGKHISKMSPAERTAAVGAAFERIEETQAEVVTGTNAIARAFQIAGLGPMLNKLITNRQGLGHTMFSDFAELRAVTSLFDVGRWGMQKIGGVGPKNLQGAKNWAIRQYEPVARSLEDLRVALPSRAKFDEVQNEMVKMMARGETVVPAAHPQKKQVQAAIDAWQRYMNLMKEKGVANGTLQRSADEATFMPIRLDPNKVRGNERQVIQTLTNHWMKQFSSTEPDTRLSIQTMRDTLGWFTQKLDKDGRPIGKFVVDEVMFPDGKLPKTLGELTELQKKAYTEGLSAPVAGLDGKTAIEHAAANYMRRQLGEEGFTGGVREFNKRRDVGRSASSHKQPNSRPRRFTQEEVFIDNPELGAYMVTDLFELGSNYASSTGFRVGAQDVLDDFLGFRGLGWHEFMVTMEQRTIDKLGMDDKSTAALRGGYEKLHEVFADLSGGLPHMDSGYNTVNRFGADAGRQSALMLYGSGIGTTIVGVENMWSLFAKVHTPADVIGNISNLVKGWAGLVTKSAAAREELAGTVMGLKRLQQHSANRFVTGSAESPGQLHWQDRLLSPWKTAIDTAMGHITPGGEGGRVGATVLRGMEAMGQNAQQIGMNRIFNETGWLIQSAATKREMKRYWARAQKLALDLEANPITGNPEEKALAFKTRAREAGFGDRFDIARRFDENNLLDSARLDRLAGNKGASLEFGKMQQHGLTLAGENRAKYFDDLDALTGLVENEVMKRISEANSLYKTTDVASRTFVGQLLNSMFSFSRAFYTNQVLDAPGMPSRVFAGMIGSYMFFEILTSQMRAVLDGHDPGDVADRWMDDPIGELMSNGSRVPLLGAYSAIPRYAIDAGRKALGNDDVRVFSYSPHQSAGTGAFEKVVQMGTDMFSAPVKYATGEQDGGEIAEDMWSHYKSIIPGVSSWYGEALSTQFDPTHGER